MSGSAWPFLVGGVICLVNSVNERDPILLNSWTFFTKWTNFLEGLPEFYLEEGWGNNRSVMLLDVLGRTRATLMSSISNSLVERPG
ncbi:hypothetical protein PCE1_002998 [Barthelona sp. PCE]